MNFTVVNESSVELITNLTTYGTRIWTFGLEKDTTNWIRQMPLLKTVDGTSIQFRIRTSDGNALITDGNVSILLQDSNSLAGRFSIGSDSLFTAFLSPFDQNYLFVIEPATNTDFNYVRNFVTVKIPKNEDTLAAITPYDVKMRGIGTNNVLNTSVEQRFRIFPYTVPYYIGDINASTFFSRNYYFRLSASNFDQNIILEDNFNGNDNDPPDPAKWFTFSDQAQSEVDIEANDLNIFAVTDGTAAAISDVNIFFEIGDVFFFEFTSPARPTINVGSIQYGGGWVVDNNVNPITAEVKFQMRRADNGNLSMQHGTTSSSAGGDGTTGSQKYTVRLERISVNEFKSTFFIDDTNQVGEFTDTISHTVYKVALAARSGNAAGQFVKAKVSSAKLFTENTFEIQPYLALQSDSRQISVQVARIYDISNKLPNVRILSEAFIEGSGLQQVETSVTDSQGQALMTFIVGTRYTLTLFDEKDVQLTQLEVVISATQPALFINIEEEPFFPPVQDVDIQVQFDPSGGTIDINTTTITVTTNFGDNITISKIDIFIRNDDINRTTIDGNITGNPIVNSFDLNGIPLNPVKQIFVTINVQTTDGNSFFFSPTYNVPRLIAGQDFLNGVIRGDFKTGLGCEANDSFNFCFPTIFLALMLSAMGTASLSFSAGIRNVNWAVVLFMMFLGIFAYFFWIPTLFYFGLFIFGTVSAIALARLS